MEAARLLRLEAEAWASEQRRQLYSTPLVPGFPWYTVAAAASRAVRRHVVPYHYTFRVFVKGRWIGQSLLDVYSAEHAHHSRQYYATCMQQGLLRRQSGAHRNVRRSCMKRSYGVDQPSGRDAVDAVAEPVILEPGDVVLHTVHRHEVPVCMGTTGLDPVVLAAVRITAYGLLVIHKPAGVPTHAGGRYFMNSCTSMLEYVLAPKRLRAWLLQRDPLLQSIVSTSHLTEVECQELLAYYAVEGEAGAGDCIPMERLPRPCHRLDKVTSGVLLFGVSQAATRRVGEALTRKTKEMEEVFLRQLRLISADGANTTRVGGVRSIATTVLEEFCVGVRKRYLARVHGCFPSRALRALASRGGEEAKDTEARHHTVADDGLFIATTASHTTLRHGDAGGGGPACAVGPSVLLASPLMQLKFRDGDTAEQPVARDSEGKQQRESVHQAAATFCQPLRHFPSGSGEQKDGDETLVQCVPFSGRMHQIRMHLSDWGHPIIGDACFGAMEQQQSSLHASASPHCKEAAAESVERGEGVKIYFRVDDLPKSCRERFHVHDGLCWECAGRLPVASLGNRNSSTIALHAWQYEMDHSLLLASVPGNAAVEASEGADAKKEREAGLQSNEQEHPAKEGKEAASNLCCDLREVRRHPDEPVQRRGESVVFFAPPPAWSQE
ncbi:tRNA pseudouridine synthase 9 [Trypanosoma conorhini]|uniref:tRNA pseudouridine synthase 9 n=1 Tax=Trypanosoma conorhini TaxID=83891 RepID=A0A3R7PZ35_9TRYP|nr:tRNA pseudouridine synthase 9 [Trypanosoma conorhini]RNF27376.1 tRNA pseudouridine synthase 9 [Trypanosoma conorhini]